MIGLSEKPAGTLVDGGDSGRVKQHAIDAGVGCDRQ
jgi:hypothetical protein